MLRNYFKTVIRSLLKDRFYTAINFVGLSDGVITCLLIFLYIANELGNDTYNVKADRICRENNEIQWKLS